MCVFNEKRDSFRIREDVAHIGSIDVKFGELFRAHAVAGSVMWGKVLASELVTG